MNSIEFEQQVETRLEQLRKLFIVKGREYAVDNDNRFHNFTAGATITGETPEKVLHMYFMKHFVSYCDMLKGIEEGKTYSDEIIREKFGDMIAYLIIQEAQFLSSRSIREMPSISKAINKLFKKFKNKEA